MQKFITIDDKIISFDLRDVKVLSYPQVDPFHNKSWVKRMVAPEVMNPGHFVLRISNLRIIKNWIPESCLRVIDVVHIGGTPIFMIWTHDTNFSLPTFELSLYEGNHTDKGSWKLLQTLSRCRFDISVDREEYEKWVNSLPVLLPGDHPPLIHQMTGIFQKEISEHSADCEA